MMLKYLVEVITPGTTFHELPVEQGAEVDGQMTWPYPGIPRNGENIVIPGFRWADRPATMRVGTVTWDPMADLVILRGWL